MIRHLPAGAPIVSAAAIRAAEGALFAAGTSQDVLMERAGAAVAEQVVRLGAGKPVIVLAGPGNNGGDAYVVARLLRERGVDVQVAALGHARDGAAARMAARWKESVQDLADASPRPILVDGLFGIGSVRPLGADVAGAVARLCSAADLKIAIDLPSGRDADTGAGTGSADVTIAIGALKPAHVLAEGAATCGHVLLADIGLQPAAMGRTITQPRRAAWRHDANKFTRGTVLVVSGAMPGAAWLAARAAVSGGAGYVTLAGLSPSRGEPHAIVRRPLAHVDDLAGLLDDDRIGSVVVGPGLGRDDTARRLLDLVLASRHDLVIDGDALTLLGRDLVRRVDGGSRRICLTPHAGEFVRVFDTAGDKITATVAAAQACGATVVHKGPDTVISSPDGSVTVCADASAGLSTAGTGDVLAGTIAARMADPHAVGDPIAAAVWLHAHAADGLTGAFTADSIAGRISGAWARCPIV